MVNLLPSLVLLLTSSPVAAAGDEWMNVDQ